MLLVQRQAFLIVPGVHLAGNLAMPELTAREVVVCEDFVCPPPQGSADISLWPPPPPPPIIVASSFSSSSSSFSSSSYHCGLLLLLLLLLILLLLLLLLSLWPPPPPSPPPHPPSPPPPIIVASSSSFSSSSSYHCGLLLLLLLLILLLLLLLLLSLWPPPVACSVRINLASEITGLLYSASKIHLLYHCNYSSVLAINDLIIIKWKEMILSEKFLQIEKQLHQTT